MTVAEIDVFMKKGYNSKICSQHRIDSIMKCHIVTNNT